MNIREERGVTIMELTAALFVVVVGLFGALQLFRFGIDRMQTMHEATVALQAVQNEVELLRSMQYTSLQDGTHAFASNPELGNLLINVQPRVEISPVEGVASYKQVHVSLAWTTENGRRAERAVTTYIAEFAP